MEITYMIFGPLISLYHNFIDYNKEIYVARKYKRLMLRNEEPSSEQFDAWLRYRFHPAVLNYK